MPVCEPSLGEKELANVSEAVRSGWVSSRGPFIKQFEEGFSKYIGTKYGVSTSNGTTAIHLALVSLGIGPGDEVIMPSFTMIASANCVSYTGAKVVLVDSEPDTWNPDVSQIERKVSPRTKAIMPVHLYGHPTDMDPVIEIARRHDLYVIEDAAEAHGAKYKGRMVGTMGDISCFSFYANKIITTGEGGMLLTDNKEIAQKASLLRDQAFDPNRRFLHRFIGFNYRMTNMQAALGVAQLERIDDFVSARRENAARYNAALKGILGIQLPAEAPWAKNVYWMYSILVKGQAKVSRDALSKHLDDEYGIETRPFFMPVHQQPAYSGLVGDESYPVAESLAEEGMNLPSSNGLKQEQIRYVTDAIASLLG